MYVCLQTLAMVPSRVQVRLGIVMFWSISRELRLSCDYDVISSGLFHHLPYDIYVTSVLLIPTTETISISGVIVSYLTHPSISMTQ
jgi:hypothetical protein